MQSTKLLARWFLLFVRSKPYFLEYTNYCLSKHIIKIPHYPCISISPLNLLLVIQIFKLTFQNYISIICCNSFYNTLFLFGRIMSTNILNIFKWSTVIQTTFILQQIKNGSFSFNIFVTFSPVDSVFSFQHHTMEVSYNII